MPMPNWERVLTTTTQEYIREVEVNILRDRKLLAMMQANGRITFGHSGTKMNWKIRHRRAPLNTFTDGDTITFAKQDRHKEATLDYRGYYTAEGVSEFETLQNRAPEAIVDFHSNVLASIEEDLTEGFGDQLYVDGNATGNTDKIHGIESFMGANLSAVAGTGFAVPSDTYAGLSTAPGTYGGSWSAAFPKTKTWPNTCIQALRRGITNTRKQKSKKGMLSMVALELEMYDQFKQAYEARQEIHVMRGEANGLLSLGFQDVINFDGCDITTEYGMPLQTGYGYNVQHMELCSMNPQLFMPDGPHWSEETRNWRTSVFFYGNARFNPRNQMKLFAYGANA